MISKKSGMTIKFFRISEKGYLKNWPEYAAIA
jgi:hypothetical protein